MRDEYEGFSEDVNSDDDADDAKNDDRDDGKRRDGDAKGTKAPVVFKGQHESIGRILYSHHFICFVFFLFGCIMLIISLFRHIMLSLSLLV